MVLTYIIISVLFLPVLMFIFLLARVQTFEPEPETNETSASILPMISFLIAARNEEDNIEDCINSILKQDYPQDKIEIIVGDDDSSDRTFEMASRFEEVKVIKITAQLEGLIGKANVLAQIEKLSTGDLLAFTDADIELGMSWTRTMVRYFKKEDMGIVSGVSVVERNDFQNTDWIMALGMVKTVSDYGIPVTGVGNNMMVKREAYEKVGGYEAVKGSIIEDYDLFKLIAGKYAYKNLFSEKVLGISKPVKGYFNLLMQRKRWMTGAVKLPFAIFFMLVLKAVFFPMILVLCFIDIRLAIWIWGAKTAFQSIYITVLNIKLGRRVSFLNLIFYEIYEGILSISLLIFYILPVKIVWKGRKYAR